MNSFLYNGVELISDSCIPEKLEKHRQERKWARRVMFERFRRFDIQYGDYVLQFNGKFYANPAVFQRIKAAIEAQEQPHVE